MAFRPFLLAVLTLLLVTDSCIGWTILSEFSQGTVGGLRQSMSNLDASRDRVKVLGVCGGIGSGKSAACQLLVSDLDCLLHIDSDTIAHTVYDPGNESVNEIRKEFGDDVVDANGVVNRRKLGEIVFAKESKMRKLERIVWPHVKQKIQDRISTTISKFESGEMVAKNPIIVVEAAVLLDADWDDFLDGIWVVSVSELVAVKRLQENRNLSAEEALKRIHAQQTRRGIGNLEQEVQKKIVTAVIDNSGSMEDLKQALAEKIDDEGAWYKR